MLLADGARVTIAGRSTDRLAAVANRLDRPDLLRTVPADIASEDQVRRLLTEVGQLDHIAVTAVDGTGANAPLAGFDVATAEAVLRTKVLGPWLVAKHAPAHLPAGGSITFTSGINAYRPAPGTSILSAANGALEALARALALEIAPILVNVVSPGWVDTRIWDVIAGAQKTERHAALANRMPGGRIGRPEEIARVFVALIHNDFVNGTLVHVDGGQRLV